MRNPSATLRVLIVGPLPPPAYGGSLFTAALVEGLSARGGIAVRSLNTQGSVSLEDVGRAGWRKAVAVAGHLLRGWRLARSFRPDVIYSPIPAALGGFLRYSAFVHLARLVGAKSVLQFHDGQFDRIYAAYPAWARAYARFTLRRAARIIVLAQRIAPMLEGIAPMARVRVVHGSRDDAPFAAARARRDTAGRQRPGSVTVLFCSHLFRDKGYLDLLEAAARVIGQRADIRFVFAGEWPTGGEAEVAKQFVARHQLEGPVEFIGPVGGDAKNDLFASSDIFALPTYYRFEAEPSVVIEAMAAGLPVIATDWAALPEMVRDGVSGYIVGVSDPPALADRILKLAADPGLRRQMGQRGRELFQSHFTRERWLNEMSAVLVDAAGER